MTFSKNNQFKNSFIRSYLLIIYFYYMTFYKILAKLNKAVLPSFSKKGLDLAKAKKWQLALIGYRAWVTKRAL